MRIYFVSFAHDEGFGNIELKFKGEINSFEVVKKVAEMIERSSPEFNNVVILNFILLDKFKDREMDEIDRD